MKALVFNPPYPYEDSNLIRSFAGGFGTVEEISTDDNFILPPIKLLSIATAIKDMGIEMDFYDYFVISFNTKQFVEMLRKKQYDYIFLTTSITTISIDCDIVNLCKSICKESKIFIYTSMTYHQILKNILKKSNVDAVLFPGSLTRINEIVNGNYNESAAYLDECGEVIVNNNQENIDVDKIPIPYRELIDHTNYCYPNLGGDDKNNFTIMQTSYGCPNQCSYYCPYPLSEGKKVKMYSMSRVIEEMESVVKLGIKNVIFRDPIFTYSVKRVEQLCYEIIRKGWEINWWCETRVEQLDVKLLKLMKKAGCIGIAIGVESGCEELIKKQAKPGITLDMVVNVKNWATYLNLNIVYLYSVGLPMETAKSIIKTFKMILKLNHKPNEFNLSFITPYPGTPLHKEAVENNWIFKDTESFSGFSAVYRTGKFTREDIRQIDMFSNELSQLVVEKQGKSFCEAKTLENNFLERVNSWAEKIENKNIDKAVYSVYVSKKEEVKSARK